MTNVRLLATLGIFLFAIILIDGAVSNKLTKHSTGSKKNEEVLGEQTETPVSPTSTENPTPTHPPTPTPTDIPRPTPTTEQHSQSNTQNFVYPGAIQTGNDGNMTRYESDDNPTTITDWYKNKIREMNMNAKTFVTTNTNGNILNKLAGSNGNSNISIEIEKHGSSKTIIRVRIS